MDHRSTSRLAGGKLSLPIIDYLQREPSLIYDKSAFSQIVDRHIHELDEATEKGESPLFVAAREKNTDAVAVIFEAAKSANIALDFNRVNFAGVSLLQTVISSEDQELIGQFLSEGKDHIDLATKFENSESFYEWILYFGDLSHDSQLYSIVSMLEFGFPVPHRFPPGETLVEHLIQICYVLTEVSASLETDDAIKSAAAMHFLLTTVKALNLLRRLAEIENDPKKRLFTEVSRDQNVLHLCCFTNQDRLLEYFLRTLDAMDSDLRKALMKEISIHGHSPLFVCVYPPAHYPQASPKSRIGCVRVLLRFGENINGLYSRGGYTLLHFCLLVENANPFQIEMSTFLIREGASVNNVDDEGYSQLFYALCFLSEPFLDAAVKAQAFEPNVQLGTLLASPISLVMNCSCTNLDEGAPVAEKVSKCMRMVRQLIAYGCVLSDVDLKNLMRFYNKNRVAMAIFPKLLKEGVEYPNEFVPGQTDIITTSVISDGIHFFRLLIKDGAPLNIMNKIVSCTKTPPHRRITHMDMFAKNRFFGQPPPDPNISDGICDVCSEKLCLELHHQLTTCSLYSCNMDLCAGCMFFTGSDEGFTAFDMARRRCDTKFLTLMNFLQETSMGEAIVSTRAVGVMDLLLNAKISEISMLRNLSTSALQNIGVLDNSDIHNLISYVE